MRSHVEAQRRKINWNNLKSIVGVDSAPLTDIRILASGSPTSKVTPLPEAKEVYTAITPSDYGGDDPTWTSMEV
jgi:hypothetical protein